MLWTAMMVIVSAGAWSCVGKGDQGILTPGSPCGCFIPASCSRMLGLCEGGLFVEMGHPPSPLLKDEGLMFFGFQVGELVGEGEGLGLTADMDEDYIDFWVEVSGVWCGCAMAVADQGFPVLRA